MIDDPASGGSPAGAWRDALQPGRACKVCCQATCGHSDLEYAGVHPPVFVGRRQLDAGGSGAPVHSLHPAGVPAT